MDKNEKKQLLEKHSVKSPLVKDFLMSYLFGGGICVIGELLKMLYMSFSVSEKDSSTLVTVTLIVIAAILTSVGCFDKIAKHAGAGTLVPVTGFSNAVVSEALDSKSEGYVLGVGSKIYTVAGPVILYGITSGAVYGVIYYIYTLFMG